MSPDSGAFGLYIQTYRVRRVLRANLILQGFLMSPVILSLFSKDGFFCVFRQPQKIAISLKFIFQQLPLYNREFFDHLLCRYKVWTSGGEYYLPSCIQSLMIRSFYPLANIYSCFTLALKDRGFIPAIRAGHFLFFSNT